MGDFIRGRMIDRISESTKMHHSGPPKPCPDREIVRNLSMVTLLRSTCVNNFAQYSFHGVSISIPAADGLRPT